MKRGRIWSRRGKILLLPLKGRRIWSGKEEGFGHEGARFRFCLLKEEGFGHEERKDLVTKGQDFAFASQR